MRANSEWQDRLIKQAWAYHRPDMTLQPLEELKDKGYTHLTWKTKKSSCPKCRAAARKYRNVEIDKFISGAQYDAPMASRAHPDDDSSHCYLLVFSPGFEQNKEKLESEVIPNLEQQIMDATAAVEEAEDESDKATLTENLQRLERKLKKAQDALEETLPPMTLDYDGNLDEA